MVKPKTVRAALTKRSAKNIEEALQRIKDDFDGWTIDKVEVKEVSDDAGDTVPELHFTLKL